MKSLVSHGSLWGNSNTGTGESFQRVNEQSGIQAGRPTLLVWTSTWVCTTKLYPVTSTSRKITFPRERNHTDKNTNSRVNHKLVFSFTVWIEFTYLFDSFPIQKVGKLSSDPPDQEVQCGEENCGRSQSLSQAVSAFGLVVSREVVRNVGGPYTGARALVSCTQSCFAFKITTSWSAKTNAEKIIIGSANKLQERRSLF